MATTSQQKKPPRPWWSKLILWTVFGLLALGASMLSFSPALPEPQPLSGQTALDGRKALSALRKAASDSGQTHVRLTWAQAQALIRLGESARSQERFAMRQRNANEAQLMASKRLPLGFWVNATAWVKAKEDGKPLIHGQVGLMPVPSVFVDPLFNLGRWWLQRRNIMLPSLAELVPYLAIDKTSLSAQLTIPADTGLLLALPLQPMVGSDPIDPALVEAHYCRLANNNVRSPADSLAVQVNRAFEGSGQDDGRARLVALGMFTGSPDLIRLVGRSAREVRKCPIAMADATLLGRRDLARHWAISAALAATLGSDPSNMMGLWKEMADSVPGGSGFSYADLAADKAGVRIAQGFDRGSENPSLKAWLAKATEEQLLPIKGMNLPEGLATSEPDPGMVKRIEAGLAQRLPRG
jgi:uncharacterized protein YfiM (DUF2279 family)